VGLDDGAADRQPHAEPVELGSEERLEDPIEIRFRDALARVAHAELQVRRRRVRSPHGHLPRRGSSVGRGGDRIGEQIQDHLLDLHRIAVHNRKAGRREEFDVDGMEQCIVRDQVDRVCREVVERERHADDVGPLQKLPRAADHVARSLVIADNVVETRMQLLEFRPCARQQALRRIGEDRRQRLGHLVRDR
jgi:hypothetical protein